MQEELEYFKETIQQNTGAAPTDEDIERINNLVIVRQEYIEAAMESVNDEYGSFENYITNGLGISDSQLEQFRAETMESSD